MALLARRRGGRLLLAQLSPLNQRLVRILVGAAPRDGAARPPLALHALPEEQLPRLRRRRVRRRRGRRRPAALVAPVGRLTHREER
eukprot:274699-Prymnesium_polylepis.1